MLRKIDMSTILFFFGILMAVSALQYTGIVAMSLEKINFVWYFKNITLIAFLGYIAGLAAILLEDLLFKI